MWCGDHLLGEKKTHNTKKKKTCFAHRDYLFRLANPVKRQRHHMGTVENISVPTTTGDGGDLASVEADGHLVRDFRLR